MVLKYRHTGNPDDFVIIAEKTFWKMMVENVKFSNLFVYKCCILHEKVGVIPIDGKYITLVENLKNDFPKCIDVFLEEKRVMFSIGEANDHAKKPITQEEMKHTWVKKFIKAFQNEGSALAWMQQNYKKIINIV